MNEKVKSIRDKTLEQEARKNAMLLKAREARELAERQRQERAEMIKRHSE